MKISKELIGKDITRTGRTTCGDGSFIGRPVEIVNVTDGLIYYMSGDFYGGPKTHAVSREKYDDGKWELWQPEPNKGGGNE